MNDGTEVKSDHMGGCRSYVLFGILIVHSIKQNIVYQLQKCHLPWTSNLSTYLPKTNICAKDVGAKRGPKS